MSDVTATRSPRTPYVSFALLPLCVLALAALFYPRVQSEIIRIEPWTADWRTVLLSDKTSAPHPEIAVVTVDNETLDPYPYKLPTPRDLLAKIVSTVDAAGARAIGIDYYFIRHTEAAKDEALVKAIRGAAGSVVVGVVDKRYPQYKPGEFAYQEGFVGSTGRRAGYLDLKHERDDVVRYTSQPENTEYLESFAALLAKEMRPGLDARSLSATRARIAWLVSGSASMAPIDVFPAREILADDDAAKALRAKIKGKAVLIGNDMPFRDHHRTPFSTWSSDNNSPGVLVHAQILAQYLDDRHFNELDRRETGLLLSALAALGFALGWAFWQRKFDYLGMSVATVALVLIDALVYSGLRLILPFTLSLWAWVIGVTAGHHARALFAWARGRVPATQVSAS